MGRDLCSFLLFFPGLVLPLLILFSSPASSEDSGLIKTFTQNLDLRDKVFSADLLFSSPVTSLLDCTRRCSSSPSCESFTLWPGAGLQCQGHSTRMMTSSQGQDVDEARTFFWNIPAVALTNVAVHKVATQGTTYSLGWGAGKAVDGSRDHNAFADQTCSITAESGEGNWWMVDLADVFWVFSVIITSRGDCCDERVENIDIKISTLDPTLSANTQVYLCHHYSGTLGYGKTWTMPCTNSPIPGRFVRVENGIARQLTLCEVEVMASTLG